MREKPSAKEIEREARLVQADMAIEGFYITLEEALNIGHQFYDSDAPDAIDMLMRKARDENRSDLEVFKEYFTKRDGSETQK